MRSMLIGGYVVVALIFAVYGNWWGDYAYKGFFYNAGRALVWPVQVIPGLGELLGIIVTLAIVGFILLRK